MRFLINLCTFLSFLEHTIVVDLRYNSILNGIMRYFIHLAYKGTHFHGWQIQPNAPSIQENLQNALAILLKQDISVIGCGRTDTGVHAQSFYAHFEYYTEIDCEYLTYKLNRLVSLDIVVFSVFRVNDDMHARFSAISRTYTYSIALQKDPFRQETALYYHLPLSVELMNEATKLLFNYTDFTSFSKLHTDVNNNNCTILRAEWTKDDSSLYFTIQANRFLRNMVRSITGTLLLVGQEKISIHDFATIIEKKDRNAAGVSVAAHALSLVEIEYPEGFDSFTHV